MSKYTTGEIAKLAGVSVRTVQYYDTRDILSPSGFSEGGRRLYTEEDLQRLKIICYLRNLGLPIKSIAELLAESEPEEVLSMLLMEQEIELRNEITQQQERLENLSRLKKELDGFTKAAPLSIDTIGDAAYKIENRMKLRKTRTVMIIVGILVDLLEWGTILYGIFTGNWMPLVYALPILIILCWWISQYYFKRVAYICPDCHTIFVPKLKEAFFARHTPNLRNVTCTHCGRKGFCVEVHHSENQITI